MNSQLAINGGKPVVDSTKAKFDWPVLDNEAEKAVVGQLHESISIYNRSGIFERFEDVFAEYHGRSLALLSNSGTSAIFSMFEAINLQPGDEVICPVYTFHATVSPMMYLGAIPIFCDSDAQGNISFEDIKQKITPRTKAVIVTHMWGVPVADILAIKQYCEDKKIWLLEDCSHAHGASLEGSKVGSFGDAASWSLQGQKIITGGEGGILLTDNKALYNRALLQGHYNKRPQQEMTEDDELKEFYLTGMGLKLRAHPIAVALAMQQFGYLDDFISQKQKYAEMFNDAFSKYGFLKTPEVSSKVQNSWYAYNLAYDESRSFGVTREAFVKALEAEGLVEVDIPGSTGLLNELPLFNIPNRILPRFYKEPLPNQGDFPMAERFHSQIIKLPVWAHKKDLATVKSYIAGIVKVSDYLLQNKALSA